MTLRTITVGDIHGCLEEFDELMKSVEYKQGKDRLLLLGDLIDRGPDPAGVVRRAREIGAECIMGNHEEKALRWRKHEKKRASDPDHYKNPMPQQHVDRLAQWAQVRDEDWDWLASLPTYSRIATTAIGGWAAAHAGCMPDVELDKQKPNELMRVRYVKTTMLDNTPNGMYPVTKMASLDERGEAPVPKQNETVDHWTKVWTGPESIVYGHYVYEHINITTGKQEGHYDISAGFQPSNAWTLGIDTGCVHGQFLTAAIFFDWLPGFETWQVAAKKTYVERKPWNEE